jgi:N-methylhydantoinase A
MLLADIRQDAVRAVPARLDALDAAALDSVVSQLIDEVSARLAADNMRSEDAEFEAACDLRYEGQFHEVIVPSTVGELRSGELAELEQRFAAEHDRLYGWSSPGSRVELVNIRVTGKMVTPKPERQVLASSNGSSADRSVRGRRRAYLPREKTFAEVTVYDGLSLLPGASHEGPLIIELPTTTVFVPEWFAMEVTPHGDFLLSVKP